MVLPSKRVLPSRRLRYHWVIAAIVATAAACGSGDTAVVASAGDLGHIHDLLLNDDGELLVASHTGLYRIEALDRAVLVGEQHDLMAMAADADTLIASGHPNLLIERYQVQGRPPFLGLVRSIDGGKAWQIVDLLGDADFHALVPTDAGLFGAETAGRIWFLDAASGEWSQLGEVEARDLAVDPADATHQLAPDYDGTVRVSIDGAASWTVLDAAPPVIEVEWISERRIVGITETGSIWVADEPGGSWTETAAVASGEDVETFYVDRNGGWWVSVHGGSIFHSSDGGGAWAQAYAPPGQP